MEKKTIFWIVVLALFIPNLALSQMQICHTFYYHTDDLSYKTISKDSLVFTKVSYSNELKRTHEIGSPELPLMCYSFIIPFDKIATRLKCLLVPN